MTNEQKEKIMRLRKQGLGYKAIGKELGVSRDTIKSFCRRNDLIDVAVDIAADNCRECGKTIVQQAKMKKKVFCSSECRKKWWLEHMDRLNKKAVYSFNCKCCGKEFSAYGNDHRKYCSRECYIRDRFGG